MQRLAEKLRTLRTRHGLTQRDLAQRIGFTQSYIYLLEHGKRSPSAEFVYKVAQLFNVTMEQLMDDAQEV